MPRVALVQTRAFPVEAGEEALAHALEMIECADASRPDLVVLPECAYPGYFVTSRQTPSVSPECLTAARNAFAGAARKRHCHLAVGMPEWEGEHFYNAGYLFGPDGDILGCARKSFLWHIDARWFDAGSDVTVCDTPIGRLGLLICADARLPEIPRLLRAKGAQVLVDMTNWVTTGSDVTNLTNPQYEFMVQARAFENRVWFVAANKVGLERDSVLYCGRSCVVDPYGRRVAAASSDKPQVVFGDIDLGATKGNMLVPGFSLADRRPETYKPLIESTPAQQDDGGFGAPLYLAVGQTAPRDPFEGAAETLGHLMANMAVFLKADHFGIAPGSPQALEERAKATGMMLACVFDEPSANGIVREFVLAGPDGRLGAYRKTHPRSGEGISPGSMYPVFKTPFGRIGFILDEEGLLPEPARILALNGAELIVWVTDRLFPNMSAIARTRAAENACFLALCGPCSGDAGSLIISPQGAILAASLPGIKQIITAQLLLATARQKLIVPCTDALAGRMPEKYGPLLGEME